jgi:hypothetical protein
MSGSLTTAQEMRLLVEQAVFAHAHQGIKRACYFASRALGISPRRVEAIRRGKVYRVWADELEYARRWQDAILRQAGRRQCPRGRNLQRTGDRSSGAAAVIARLWLARICRWMAGRQLGHAERWVARAERLERRDANKASGVGA